jgi:hypothetical protein
MAAFDMGALMKQTGAALNACDGERPLPVVGASEAGGSMPDSSSGGAGGRR